MAGMTPIDFSAVAAEFFAMLMFVFICAGSATGVAGTGGWVQQVSLTFGFAITCLAYTIGHYSGGQINCAVTFGLVIAGKLEKAQAVANFGAQVVGSIVGAYLLALVKHKDVDLTGGLATNSLGAGISPLQALLGEFLMTFLLMYVVLETAVNPKTKDNRSLACVAIGMAVYLAHSVLIPVDGCSINPTRSIGPAIIATLQERGDNGDIWNDHWVFWLGPLLGSAVAVYWHIRMNGGWMPEEEPTSYVGEGEDATPLPESAYADAVTAPTIFTKELSFRSEGGSESKSVELAAPTMVDVEAPKQEVEMLEPPSKDVDQGCGETAGCM